MSSRIAIVILRVWRVYARRSTLTRLPRALIVRPMMQEVPSARATTKVEAVGLDFGTTNSAIAIVGTDGSPRLARFSAAEGGDQSETFRSILFFEAPEETGGTDSAVSVGNDAIRRYLAAAGNGRLVQSLKSFL